MTALPQPTPILQLEMVTKTYREPAGLLRVLDDLCLSVPAGEVVLLQGPSGSGKLSLLPIAGGLLRADSGNILLAGHEINNLSEAERTAIRRRSLGFALQYFHLVEAPQSRRGRGRTGGGAVSA